MSKVYTWSLRSPVVASGRLEHFRQRGPPMKTATAQTNNRNREHPTRQGSVYEYYHLAATSFFFLTLGHLEGFMLMDKVASFCCRALLWQTLGRSMFVYEAGSSSLLLVISWEFM